MTKKTRYAFFVLFISFGILSSCKTRTFNSQTKNTVSQNSDDSVGGSISEEFFLLIQ
jgi:hypothetical protein